MDGIAPWQVDSFLLAMHNIATAIGVIAFVLALYPWLGAFGSQNSIKVELMNKTGDKS